MRRVRNRLSQPQEASPLEARIVMDAADGQETAFILGEVSTAEESTEEVAAEEVAAEEVVAEEVVAEEVVAEEVVAEEVVAEEVVAEEVATEEGQPVNNQALTEAFFQALAARKEGATLNQLQEEAIEVWSGLSDAEKADLADQFRPE